MRWLGEMFLIAEVKMTLMYLNSKEKNKVTEMNVIRWSRLDRRHSPCRSPKLPFLVGVATAAPNYKPSGSALPFPPSRRVVRVDPLSPPPATTHAAAMRWEMGSEVSLSLSCRVRVSPPSLQDAWPQTADSFGAVWYSGPPTHPATHPPPTAAPRNDRSFVRGGDSGGKWLHLFLHIISLGAVFGLPGVVLSLVCVCG